MADGPDNQQHLQALLATMSMQTPAERTRALNDLAQKDPETAAHLSLLIGNRENGRLPARFAVSRRIGQGGFGAVYEAFDHERNRPVALKILRHSDAEALYRFKQEFRMLADLRHPNLIRFHELIEFHDLWFITMELVNGGSLLRYVRPHSHCDFVRLRSSLRDLSAVLAWLHRRQLMHRDIKPENVLVEHSGRLVLLDFGLALHLTPSANTGTISVGTPAYMAPEQISRDPVTAAADMYAVGVILYQALTGRLPFNGEPIQVLAAKNTADPPPPSSLVPDIPPEWNSLCLRLMNRNPAHRPDAGELLAWLGESDRGEISPAGVMLAGRQSEMQALLNAARTALTGVLAAVEIEGPSGYGKSKLLDAFSETVSQLYPDALVVRGRCYEHESVPFKAIDAMMDDLSRRLRHLGANLESCLSEDIGALTRLFPVLDQVQAIVDMAGRHPIRIMNAAELRRRAFAAFAALLSRLAETRLVVICLDDVQWGDDDSAALLEHVLLGPAIPPVMLVTSHRSDSATPDFVRFWRERVEAAGPRLFRARVTVGPLEPPATAQLARSLLVGHNASSEELIQTIAAESGGNPLLLEQLAAEAVNAPVQGRRSRRLTVKDLVHERVLRLSEAARSFLEMLAAAGEPLPEALVNQLAPADRLSAISSLISQNLVRRLNSDGKPELEIYHEQLRSAIIEHVPEPERRALHLRIANGLVSIGYADPGMIAVQYARAGDTREAARYAIEAGAAAEAVFAFDRAAQFFAMALALGDFDPDERSGVFESMARAQASSGHLSDSANAYLKAAEFTTSAQRGLRMRRHAAEELIRGGNLREGIAILRSLGAEYDIRQTDRAALAVASIAWSKAKLALRGWGYRERPQSELPERTLARLDIYWALSAGLGIWNPVIGASFQFRYLLLALETGEPRRIGLAFAAAAGYVAIDGERAYSRARSLLEQANEIGTRLDDAHILGTVRAMDAICAWLTGRWDQAREVGEEAERFLRENCAGVTWQLGVARNAMIGGLIWTGEWKALGQALRELTQDARDRGDLTSLAVYLNDLCIPSIAAGKPDEAERDLDEAERILETSWSARGFHIVHLMGLLGRAQIAIYRGNAAAALPLINQGMKKARRSFVFRVRTFAILAVLQEGALFVAAAQDPATPARDRARLLKRARASADATRARPGVWSLGLALLLDGCIEAACDRPERACLRWQDAQRELERSGMRLYAASAQYWRGRLTGDRQLESAAEAVFREKGIAFPERIAAMLAPGVRRNAD
jgi:eukaryotic-like serine/threonine-protein kinase